LLTELFFMRISTLQTRSAFFGSHLVKPDLGLISTAVFKQAAKLFKVSELFLNDRSKRRTFKYSREISDVALLRQSGPFNPVRELNASRYESSYPTLPERLQDSKFEKFCSLLETCCSGSLEASNLAERVGSSTNQAGT
jgi:hypothetical protein